MYLSRLTTERGFPRRTTDPGGAVAWASWVACSYPQAPTSGVSTPITRIVPFVVTTVSPSTQWTTFAEVQVVLRDTAFAGADTAGRRRATASSDTRTRVKFRWVMVG